LFELQLLRAAASAAVGQEEVFCVAACTAVCSACAAAVAVGQEDVFCAEAAFAATVWIFAASLFDGAAELTAFETLFLEVLETEILEAVKFEAAETAADSGCACATPEQAARLDASTKLNSIEITFFLLILFISCSPFLKRLFKVYACNPKSSTPHDLAEQKPPFFPCADTFGPKEANCRRAMTFDLFPLLSRQEELVAFTANNSLAIIGAERFIRTISAKILQIQTKSLFFKVAKPFCINIVFKFHNSHFLASKIDPSQPVKSIRPIHNDINRFLFP
jgi:hypothetical protein